MKKTVFLHSAVLLAFVASSIATPIQILAEDTLASSSVETPPSETDTSTSTDASSTSDMTGDDSETLPSSTSEEVTEPSSSTSTSEPADTLPSSSQVTQASSSSTKPVTQPSTQPSSTTEEQPADPSLETATETAVAVPERAAVNPIRLGAAATGYSDRHVTITGKIDWQPDYLDLDMDIVDSKGRSMYHRGVFLITNKEGNATTDVKYYPDGVYTVIVHGKTGRRDGYKQFIGRTAFYVRDGRFVSQEPVPVHLSGIVAPNNYVYEGINQFYFDITPYQRNSRYFYFTTRSYWLPEEFTGSVAIYNLDRKAMASKDISHGKYGAYLNKFANFDLDKFPDGTYVIVASGEAGELNHNQKFYGQMAIRIQNGRYQGEVAVPADFSMLKPANVVPVYRLYNASRKAYLFTKNQTELNRLIASGQWKNEGVAWKTSDYGANVYRLYHPTQKVHFYTRNYDEYQKMVPRGWKQEGVAYRSAGSVVIYRLYNAKTKKYFFTKNVSERDLLVKRGWNNEGIGWYGMP